LGYYVVKYTEKNKRRTMSKIFYSKKTAVSAANKINRLLKGKNARPVKMT